MTSATGSEEMKLAGTVDPPSFISAILGAAGQVAAMVYLWSEFAGVTPDQVSAALYCPVNSTCGAQLVSAPWAFAVAANLVLAGLIFLTSVALRDEEGLPDPGIVDRLWSITPVLNVWLMYASTGSNHRLLIMAILSTFWGARLTWNYWRKGGYTTSGEDYRWVQVRKWFPGWRFHVFNPIFICLYQVWLLLSIAAPAAIAGSNNTALNFVDGWAIFSFVALLVGETVADIQMFNFQTEKWRRKKNDEELIPPYDAGFLRSGLWSVSRHPNYFCEVHIWWTFYVFSIAASGQVLNWSILGAIMLECLFVMPNASLDVTEALSSRKYPLYEEYQKNVPRFWPWGRWQTLLLWVILLVLVVHYEGTRH